MFIPIQDPRFQENALHPKKDPFDPGMPHAGSIGLSDDRSLSLFLAPMRSCIFHVCGFRNCYTLQTGAALVVGEWWHSDANSITLLSIQASPKAKLNVGVKHIPKIQKEKQRFIFDQALDQHVEVHHAAQ